MRKIIFLLLFIINISLADENPKVVINLTTGDLSRFNIYLLSGLANSAEYYKNQLKEIKVVVVIHGDAYKFFIKDLQNSPYKNDKELLEHQKEIISKLESLVKNYKVKFQMCEAGMKSKKINKETLYDFVELIPNAFIGLVDWQNKGYAYIHIQ